MRRLLRQPLLLLLLFILLLFLFLLNSTNVEGKITPHERPPVPPTLTTTAALLKVSATHSHVLYLRRGPSASEVRALQGHHSGHRDTTKDRTDTGVDASPSGLKTDPVTPVGGSEGKQWEGYVSDGLLTEVHTDVGGALRELQERPTEYSSVSVVVHGSPSFLQETVKQAVGMGVVMPRRAWVLVSETAEWHQSALPSTLFTNQYNLVLVTPLLRTPRTHASDQCVAAIHRLTFLSGGLAWAGVGCGRASGRLSLTANPFSLPDHLGNITIPVAVVKGSPTLRLVKTSDGEDYLDGFLGEMLRLLQRDLLFRVQVSQVPGFGNRLANGTWIGTVGAVARKEVELGLASLSISHIRNQVVDFSDYLISTGVYLMYLARQLTQPVSTVFLVFSPELWGCLLGQITLLGAVLYLACYRDAARRNHSPLYYLFASYRSFVYQGTLEPRSSAPRLTYLSSLIFALVVYALYSGNLTAVLSLPRLQEYPKSAEEMLEQGYAPILTEGFHQYDYFKFSPLDAFRTLFRHAEERGTIYPFGRIDHKTALQRFSKGRVASIITPLGIMFRQNSGAGPQQPCPFYVESAPLNLGFISIILQKNSFFSEIINTRLRWLRDSGNLKEIYGRYNMIQCVPSGRTSGTSRPLSLTVLLGAFVMWVCGFLVACITFLLEFLSSRG